MKITNIGILNIQKTSDELLHQCEELTNIGFVIGTDQAFEKIQPCRISNVGMTLKVPVDMPLIFQDEDLVLDDDFLMGLAGKTVFVVNGDCIIQTEKAQLIQEKIDRLVVNGNTYCPSSLKGSLSTLSQFNGRVIPYKNGATFFKDPLHLTESLLFRLPKNISTNQLRAFDPKLAASIESFESIEVLDTCWLERGLFSTWSDKIKLDLSAELQILEAPVRYHKSSETLSVQELSVIAETTLAIDGTLTVTGKSFEQPKQVTAICCSNLRASEAVVEGLKPLLLPDTQVETLESNKRVNQGKLTITADQLTDLEHPMRLKNKANLIFDASVTPEMIKSGIVQITNFGMIKAPKDLLPAITAKTVKNFGKIKALEILKTEAKKEYAYENMGYLAL
jgi:hypothetical protein